MKEKSIEQLNCGKKAASRKGQKRRLTLTRARASAKKTFKKPGPYTAMDRAVHAPPLSNQYFETTGGGGSISKR